MKLWELHRHAPDANAMPRASWVQAIPQLAEGSSASLRRRSTFGSDRPRHAESQWPTESCEVQALRMQLAALAASG